jgi:hypothetical protein
MALNDATAEAVFPAAKPAVRGYALRAAGPRLVSSVRVPVQSSLGRNFAGLAHTRRSVD